MEDKILNLLLKLKQKDIITYQHSLNVARYSLLLGEKIYLDDDQMETLLWASLLHDVGKLLIPLEILNKPEKLTEEEYDLVKYHTVLGSKLLKTIGIKDEKFLKIIEEHHERFDGKGYPFNLSQSHIPFLTRIISLADSFDAMTSNRTYRQVQDINFAENQLEMGVGSQFDPLLTEIFLNYLKDFYLDKQKNEKLPKQLDAIVKKLELKI